jgi:predicted nucleic acid-binding Zn ribbon protein
MTEQREQEKKDFGDSSNALSKNPYGYVRKLAPRKCAKCGKEFKPKNYSQKFCSPQCATRKRFCLYCGAELPSGHKRPFPRFCGENCSRNYDFQEYRKRFEKS